MHEVKDAQKKLRFEGELLAQSSSHKPGRERWVEFELYKTSSNSYVLSRVGHSTIYHDVECEVAARNDLEPTAEEDIDFTGAYACDVCHPSETDEEICFEKPRYWAQVSTTPEGVIEALYKWDGNGTRYMTYVAKRLIEDAGKIDPLLDEVYRTEYIY